MSPSAIPKDVIGEAWKRACKFWGATLDIAEPVDVAQKKGDSIAYIELTTRQVAYNSSWFLKRKILDCFPAVFAHELAHHMRYPQTLRVSAELMLMGNHVSPGLDWSMINLFLDLLVNEHVGRDVELRRELIKMYVAIAAETKSEMYKAYLGVYESLWFGEADFSLQLKDSERALIRSFTDSFYQLSNIYEQFLFFLSFFMKYYEMPPANAFVFDPLTGDSRLPTVEDFPIDGSWSKGMVDAYRRAKQEKWGELQNTSGKPKSGEEFRALASVMRQLAGHGQPNAPQKAALRYYRSLVEKAIDELPLRLPGEKEPLEILSAAEEWQFDDDPRLIDWSETVIRAGAMASASPFKRQVFLEPSSEATETDLGIPDFEIYLDTSGSMPSPVENVNAMTLAALVLATYAVRKGGRVYGVVYSSGTPIISEGWMLEEEKVQGFFLNYFGGGTDYPFSLLKKRSETCKGAYRVIISDSDFLSNVSSVGTKVAVGVTPPVDIVCEAADHSKALVLLFHRVTEKMLREQKLHKLIEHPRIWFVPVADSSNFARVAASLGQALLGTL